MLPMNSVQTADFDWLSWQLKYQVCRKEIFKNLLLISHEGDEAETFKKCS